MWDLETVAPLLESRHLAMARELDEFVRAEIAALEPPADDDAGRAQAREVLALLGESGWARYAVPDGDAESVVDLRSACLIRERLAWASPLADAVFALQALGSRPLVEGGGDAIAGRWLQKISRGEVMTAFAMTEPGAGSDVGAIGTRATPDGGGWRLDGRKWLISNAGIADLYLVFATTDPDAGSDGLSCFAVPADADGLRYAGPQVLSAPHPLGRIDLDGCRVPADHLVGEPGDGFGIGMRTLDRLRPTVAAAACGMANRALEEARDHAGERRQFGRSLDRFQLVQASIADMATELEGSRLLTYRAAWEADHDRSQLPYRSAMAKLAATESAQRVVDRAVQILGGRGVLADSPVDHLYRSVRALRIYEGASDIQRLVIARRMPG